MNSPDPSSLAQYEGNYPVTFGRSMSGELMITRNGRNWHPALDPVEYALHGDVDILEAMERFLEEEQPYDPSQQAREPVAPNRSEAQLSGGHFDYLFAED